MIPRLVLSLQNRVSVTLLFYHVAVQPFCLTATATTCCFIVANDIIFLTYAMCSSVARGEAGGLEPLYWPEMYAKSHSFRAFEADFCSKNENIPPPKGIWEPKL